MHFHLPRGRWRLARLCPWAALALAAWAGVVSAQAQTPTPLSLAEALQLATTQSRKVDASALQVDAAQQRTVAAGQRPDPVLTLGIDNLPVTGTERFSLTRDFMTMRTVGVMQELTRGDKLQARSARSLREAELARASGRQVLAELQRDVALAWLASRFQQGLRDLWQGQQEQAVLQVQAAEAAYRSGKGSPADVFAARGQAALMQDRVAQAEGQLSVARIQLARWIGDAATRPPAPPPPLERPAWARDALAPNLSGHAPIDLATQREALALADVGVANANRAADWSVALAYSQRGPAYSNMVSLNLSLPLQWDRAQRQDRELAAAQALARQAAAEREDRQREYEAELRAQLAEWQTLEQRLQRHHSALLPLAAQRSEAALAAYRGGGANLAAVLEARRGELDLRMDRLRIEYDIARLWAQLHYLDPAAAGPGSTP